MVEGGRAGVGVACCRAGVALGRSDNGFTGLRKGFCSLPGIDPRPTRLSRCTALETPNVREPRVLQISSQLSSVGSSITGVIERKFEGDETALEVDK